ncbi:MAG: response regulator [Trebonia sp.]
MTVTDSISDELAPRMLICVCADATGVLGAGERPSLLIALLLCPLPQPAQAITVAVATSAAAARRCRRTPTAPLEDEGPHPFRRRRRCASLVAYLDQGEAMSSVAIDSIVHRAARSGAPPQPTRLLIVDDHTAVRAGLRELLEDEEDFEVAAAVASAEAGISIAECEPIDIAVVDYQLGGPGTRNGLWLSRKLKRLPKPPAVLIYSAYTDGVLAAAAIVAEADGIVSKGRLGSELCAEIRHLAAGRTCLSPVPPWLAEALRRRFGHEEQAIFGMLMAGIEPAEIAETLGLSSSGLEARLWAMLRSVEAPHGDPQLGGSNGHRGRGT